MPVLIPRDDCGEKGRPGAAALGRVDVRDGGATFNAPTYAYDPRELVREMNRQRRQEEALGGGR